MCLLRRRGTLVVLGMCNQSLCRNQHLTQHCRQCTGHDHNQMLVRTYYNGELPAYHSNLSTEP